MPLEYGHFFVFKNGINKTMSKPKLIRVTTVSKSLKRLLKGQLKYMNSNGFEVIAIASPGEFMFDVEKYENVPTYEVKMSRGINVLQDLKSIWKLYKIYKKEQPDIVHTHTPKAGFVGIIAAYFAGVPVRLHTVAGLPLMETIGIKRKILNFVEKLTYRLATRVYPNSKNLRKFIIREKLTSSKKLKVIGHGSSNGIDTSEFNLKTISNQKKEKIRENLSLSKNDFIFLYVGRLVKDKGVNELIQAFLELSKCHKDVRLILAGDNDDNTDPLLPQTLKHINNHQQIYHVGYVNNIVDYFAFADVFVFPSYREGFPNVVLQAAAMQLNAIVTDINGSNEIVEDQKNGFIIPVKDAKKIEEKMLWSYKNKEESKKMGLKSRQIIIDRFERTVIWELIKDEYHLELSKTNV